MWTNPWVRIMGTTDYEILLVDDDEICLMVCERFLQITGSHALITKVVNGRDALRHLLRDNPTRNILVLLDLNMPIMNGWEFLDCLKCIEMFSNVRVVIISSSIDAADVKKSHTYPMVARYIEKPTGIKTFTELMNDPEMKQFFE